MTWAIRVRSAVESPGKLGTRGTRPSDIETEKSRWIAPTVLSRLTTIGDRWKFIPHRMSHTLTPYYKRIIRRQLATGRFNNESEVIRHSLRVADSLERAAGPLGCSFAGREDLEELLLEGLNSGAGKPMTAARKKQIYKQALEEA